MHNTAGIATPQVLTVLRRQQWQSAANPTHTPTDWRPAPRRWTGVFAARWTAPPRLHSGVGQERGQEMWASGTRRPTERRSGIAVARLMGGGSNKPAQKTRRPAYAACCIQTSPGSPTMLCCSAVRSTIRSVSSTRPSICRINLNPRNKAVQLGSCLSRLPAAAPQHLSHAVGAINHLLSKEPRAPVPG